MTLARVLLSLVLMVSFTEGQKNQPQPNTAKVESKTALTIEWITPPRLSGTSINGSLLIYNATDNEFDQTVVVLAVNEIGKAFALGYQHFTLPHKSISMPIRFDSNLPPGRYVIHADAVAEVPTKQAIYRARLQTPTALVVSGI
jgi:hypothetical protein